MAEQKQAPIDNMELFAEIGRKYNYRKQGIFFLNAFWAEHSKEAEQVWEYVHCANEMDKKQQKDGHSLDEFEAHRFLEKFGQPLTVVAMRAELKKIDIDSDNRMSLLEYVVYHYKLDVDTLMTRPQGINEEVEKAELALQQVLEEIEKIEKKKKRLQAKAEGSGVKALKAKNALEQLLAADQLPLNKALVTAKAALRAAQKSKNLNAMGKLWYIEREMKEAAKYKPKANWKRANLD